MVFELRPFRIGRVPVASPLVLAPMAGYTDLPFRLLCRRMGCPFATTEMMLDRLVLLRGKIQIRMLAVTAEDHPAAAQIVGSEPDVMARAAAGLCEHGFDVVDLNFACPVRKALSRGRGGHLLTQPALAGQIVRAVAAVVDRPFTVKVRRRYHDAHGDDAFWAIAEEAFAAGAAAICVHARSVAAKYSGRADWDFLAAVRRRFPDRTIVGSGDALSPQSALEMLQQTGVDAVSVARGALGNPWFFRQAADLAAGRPPYLPTLAEQRHAIETHLAGTIELYGPTRGPRIMRKHGIKYARMHPTPKAARAAFVLVKTADQWRRVLDELYPQESPTSEGANP